MAADHRYKSLYARFAPLRQAVLAVLLTSTLCHAQQSIVEHKTVVQGATTVNSSYSRNIQIFVVFPPGLSSADNASFRQYVATYPSIDGFTVSVNWSSIEKAAPTSDHSNGNCTAWAGHNTDTCVLDSIGQYHSYTWTDTTTPVDDRSKTGIWQWFDDFSGKKKVNILFFGMTGVNSDGVQTGTPDYVANPSYVNLFTPAVQDVINSIQNGCTSWSGHSITDGKMSRSPGQSIVTVNLTGHGYMANDKIWVNNVSPNDYNTTTAGKTIISIIDSDHFTYDSGIISTFGDNNHGGNLIASADSWLVPYELPYKTAYRAALTALFIHFQTGYHATDQGHVSHEVSQQLGYIRFGHSVGAEAFPYCTGSLGSLGNGYNYVPDTGTPLTSVGWTGDYYTGNLTWAGLQRPFMKVFAPLNQVSAPTDGYGMREAAAAAGSTTGAGFFDGFGSQGLSLLDKLGTGCPGAASYWCSAFGTWYPHGMPLELQQISLSDPFDGDCTTQSPLGGCGIPPNDSGDLRQWLPFAVQNHLSVLELYYRDAALAFDPNYCVLNSQTSPASCTSASYTPGSNTFLTPLLQFTFFQSTISPPSTGVGIGAGCANNVNVPITQTGASGDCSYATAINNAHGYQGP